MILAETYTQLLASPGHWLFEITLEILTALIVYPVLRLCARRFHAALDKEHGVEHPTPGEVVLTVDQEAWLWWEAYSAVLRQETWGAL